LHLIQVFEHTRARPVRIGAILEQDIDEGVAKERIAAHRFRSRHRHHRGGERIGNLILDDARRLAGVRRANDDLHVGEVGQRVERRACDRPQAPRRDQQGRDQHQKAVGERPADERGDHFTPCFPIRSIT
jgi:hypothetical protein